MSLERVVDTTCDLGEGPIWHPDEYRLYWVDIDAGVLHRYHPSTDTYDRLLETDVAAGLTLQEDGSLLVFMDRGTVGRVLDGELTAVERVVDADSRFNDVIADPQGRVFCGTMPTESSGGKLYRLDTDGTATEVEDGVGIPNGMGFTSDLEHFYFTETEAQTIFRYSYDESTGAITDRERFIETPNTPGFPDGMTVDSAGFVWSARWEGGRVVRYDENGVEREQFDVPANKVTSVAFGGPTFDSLYVTTAGGSDRRNDGPGAGALFRLSTDAAGRPEFRSSVSLS